MSSTLEVGKTLVEFCQQGKFKEAVEALYNPSIVSIEAMSAPGESPRVDGIAAVRAKGEWWVNNHEIHSAKVAGPWPHGDRFIVHFTFEVTPKAGPMTGKRITIDEAALYTVQEGKIVREEFFYHMG